MTPRVAVITTVAGRHAHLLRQRAGLLRGPVLPDLHVVVAMGDPTVRELVGHDDCCVVLDLEVRSALPLARARNLGAAEARRRGAEVLVFLDVDCIPSPGLVARYATLSGTDQYRDSLLCGQVNYLPADFAGHADVDALEEGGIPHRARPVLLDRDAVVATDDFELFWALSFAVSARAWQRLGGFCESYTGYGAEDTDFAQCAKTAGVTMHWVGGATAYHQHHPVSDPPVEHLSDILVNGEIYARRWGTWPMGGWLQAFERQGLVTYDQANRLWRRTDSEQVHGTTALAAETR